MYYGYAMDMIMNVLMDVLWILYGYDNGYSMDIMMDFYVVYLYGIMLQNLWSY